MNGRKVLQTAMIMFLGIIPVASLTNHAFAGELLDKVTGKVKVQDQTLHGEQLTKLPQTLYIQDFDLDYRDIDTNEGLLDRSAARRRVPILRQKNDPEQKARNLVNLMSESLQENFKNAGIAAQKIDSGKGLPKEGWLVRGVFTEAEEGGV